MSPLSLTSAKKRVKRILAQYHAIRANEARWFENLTEGKIYEFYVLSKLLLELKKRGFLVKLKGGSIKFQCAPGKIDPNNPHFEIRAPGHSGVLFQVFTDIEVRTLGSRLTQSNFKCAYHELDIVVVRAGATGRPLFDEVALAIECKAVAVFKKFILKQALGNRRELCLLYDKQLSMLSKYQSQLEVEVPANPPSEFWIAYIDPKGDDYKTSPAAFGIDFKHWQP